MHEDTNKSSNAASHVLKAPRSLLKQKYFSGPSCWLPRRKKCLAGLPLHADTAWRLHLVSPVHLHHLFILLELLPNLSRYALKREWVTLVIDFLANIPTAWYSHLHVTLWEWCISFLLHSLLQVQFLTQSFSGLSPFILALTIMWPTGNWMERLLAAYQKWFSSCYFWSDFSLKSLYKVRFSNVSILFSNLILL